MKRTITESDFLQAFVDYGRKDNFSRDGLVALYNYLEEFSEGTGVEVELDVIGICCDFSEYENIKEFQEHYGDEYKTLEDIEERTIVIPIDNKRFIIQDF